MTEKLDQSGDLNFSELTRYARLYNFPEFVKSASLGEISTPDTPKPTVYADVRPPYQFPCHTKAAAYVSYIYFLEKQAKFDATTRERIKFRLDKFAEYWGIKNSIHKALEKHAELHNDELDDSYFALVGTNDSGVKERRYPLRNALEVKKAADWFCTYLREIRSTYTFPERQKIATSILEKANEYGADIGDNLVTLEQSAGKGVFDPHLLASEISRRLKLAKVRPELAASMEKLATLVKNQPEQYIDPATSYFLAKTLDDFDRNHGLMSKYASLISSPEEAVFTSTLGQIADLRKHACATTTGSVYDRADLEKVSLTDIKELFGDDLVDEVSKGLKVDVEKLAEIVATLPIPDAEMFDDLLRSKGVKPMAKQAGHSLGFTFNEWRSLVK